MMRRRTDVRITHRCPLVTAVIMLSNATILILKLLYQLPLIVFIKMFSPSCPSCDVSTSQGHPRAILMYLHSISLPYSLCHRVATGTKPYNNSIFIYVKFKQCAKHTTFHNPIGHNDQPRPVSRSGMWGPIHPCLCLNLKIKLKM